ncbi:MAG: leucine-rich repeat protein [Ruminococcus sp.]|nr:leucine-rich repeat protein [Ruminococcus sp.]
MKRSNGIKRFIAGAAALVLISGTALPQYRVPFISGVTASAASSYGDLTYTAYSDHVTITACDQSAVSVTVPETIDGLPVTEIANKAFMYCSSLESLTLPDSIESIGSYAFWECRKMVLTELPASLKALGHDAFYYCEGITALTIPAGVTEIEEAVFYSCHNLKTLKMSDNVVSVGPEAFRYCRKLESIAMSKNITYIGDLAFNDCQSLLSIDIPDTLSGLGYHAFLECPAELTLPDRVKTGFQSNSPGSENERNGAVVKSYINYISGDDISLLAVSDNRFITAETRSISTGEVSESKTIDYELPLFGGAYCGEDYNYLVFGQANTGEDDSREVIRIVKYDKSWKRISSCSVSGVDVYMPFDGGSMRFDEDSSELYIHTCRTMYDNGDGKHHQSSLSLRVKKSDMTWVQNTRVYASHSFDQYVRVSENSAFFSDLGDAYPRSVVVSSNSGSTVDVLEIQGTLGANDTGVSLGGMEIASGNIITAGNSVDQSSASSYDPDGVRDIFVASVPVSLGSSEITWITNYRSSGADSPTVLAPKLIKQDEDTLWLLWEEVTESGRAQKLVKLGSDGKPVSDITDIGSSYPLSDCVPVLDSGVLTWFTTASDGGDISIIRLDPEAALDPDFVPPVTTTAVTTTAVTTQTTAAASSQTTAQTSAATTVSTTAASDDIRKVTFSYSGLALSEGDKVYFDISKADGYISQLTVTYYDSTGTPSASVSGGIFTNYLDSPGTRTETFTAPCDVDTVYLTFRYTGGDPEISLRMDGYVIIEDTTTAADTSSVSGDANCDKRVNMADAVAVLQCLANEVKYPLTEQGRTNADCDGNAGLTGQDAIAIQRFDAGEISTLPLG